MAQHSLLDATVMKRKEPRPRRCSYVVPIDAAAALDVSELARYFSSLAIAGCEVLVLDSSSHAAFEENQRVLRWVARHVARRTPFDPVRTSIDLASCEKIIIASHEVRYSKTEIEAVCGLLEIHEVVEPQEYVDPLPWWSGIDAGRILVHRGVEPLPDHGSTFGFRKGMLRSLREIDSAGRGHVCGLAARGAEVFSAFDLFVRRQPPPLREWLLQRPRLAADDFALPRKTALFLALIPMTLLLAVFAGVRVATGYTLAVEFLSVLLAFRGRAGAEAFFPLRACLLAPLWVIERSVSVYWAVLQMLTRTAIKPAIVAIDPRGREEVASGANR